MSSSNGTTPGERLALFIAHLREHGEVYNDMDFSNRTGIGNNFISDMKVGRKVLSARTARRIAAAFPWLNPEWLLTGAGEMLRPAGSGGNSPLKTGQCSDRMREVPAAALGAREERLLDLNESTHALLAESQRQVAEGQRQVGQLLGIAEAAHAALAESQRQVAMLIETVSRLGARWGGE